MGEGRQIITNISFTFLRNQHEIPHVFNLHPLFSTRVISGFWIFRDPVFVCCFLTEPLQIKNLCHANAAFLALPSRLLTSPSNASVRVRMK